jgi:uncharacterized repeat protein (TIGR01451 family)
VGDITCLIPVLAIAKTPDGGQVAAGSTATFTVVVTNNGPGTATNVTVSDPLPAGNGVSWSTATAGCAVTGAVGAQSLNCTVASLAQGASATVVVTAPITVQNCATLNNTATASASNAVAVTDSASITCAPPTLTISKTPDGGSIQPGATAQFNIVVSNNGPGAALGVTLNDPLPAGGGVNWQTTSAGCTITGAIGAQTLNCTLGDLAVAGSATVIVTAVTSPATCTTMTNTAIATATNASPVTDTGSISCLAPPPATIPTLSEMGMLLLATLVMAAGFVTLRRRRM